MWSNAQVLRTLLLNSILVMGTNQGVRTANMIIFRLKILMRLSRKKIYGNLKSLVKMKKAAEEGLRHVWVLLN